MQGASFEIEHGWGDPREPDYKNNLKVSFAYYKEDGVRLTFLMYPLTSGAGAPVVMEVPANIRMSLGNDWSKCEIVIQRVVDYLKNVDESVSHRKYNDIVIDALKVPKWFPTLIKLFEKNHPFIFDNLPSAGALLLILLGVISVIQKRLSVFSDIDSKTVGWIIGVLGVSILGMLLSDIYNAYKRWMFIQRYVPLMFSSMKPKDFVKGDLKHYGLRYLLIFSASMFFVYEGFK